MASYEIRGLLLPFSASVEHAVQDIHRTGPIRDCTVWSRELPLERFASTTAKLAMVHFGLAFLVYETDLWTMQGPRSSSYNTAIAS